MAISKTKKDCCAPRSPHPEHPDHTGYLARLNRAQGQIEGISKMIGDRRYCVDILTQFRAVMAALRNIEAGIFETHLEHCVDAAVSSKDKRQAVEKIRELTQLLSRRTTI
jgi:DNA-binding FrmR family transcriptional regulator